MLTVILKGSMCLKPNWIKIYDIKHNFFDKCVFQFWKKKTQDLSFKNGHFFTFVAIFMAIT